MPAHAAQGNRFTSTADYNEELALGRSKAARDYLIRRGVPAARLMAESRGEQDATGDAPATWMLDRDVQINAADELAKSR